MDDKNNTQKTPPSAQAAGAGAANNSKGKPQWSDSLRDLYDSVVDEPIPDSFKDLLAQLDEPKKGDAADGGAA